MEPVDLLLRYPLFGLLGRDFVSAWASMGDRLATEMGLPLLTEGKPGKVVYLVLAGKVRLTRADSAGMDRPLGCLGPGAVFGEYAVIPPHLNTAGCRACQAGEVLRLPLLPLRLSLEKCPNLSSQLKNWLRLHELVNQFRFAACPAFLSGPSVLGLFECCEEIRCTVAHTLQDQGLLDDSWLYIRRGEVRVQERNGRSQLLGVGDCLGQGALLDGSGVLPAVALSETECWRLPRDKFQAHTPGSVCQQTLRPARRHRPCWEWLRQRGPSDCGVAALAMAALALGVETAYEKVRAVTRVGDHGASLADLAEAAGCLDLRATVVRIGLEQLRLARLPAVALLHSRHFVTLFELGPDRVVLGDPAECVRSLSLEEFRRIWSGNLLLLSAPVEAGLRTERRVLGVA